MTDLEKTVVQFQKAGQDWVEARLKADQLDEDSRPFLASIINELDDGQTSETKLDRKARGSKPYRDYISAMCVARAEALRLKVKFDSYSMLFSAKQSEMAYQREKLSKGVYHQGQG